MQKLHLPGKTTVVLTVLVVMTITVIVLRVRLAVTGGPKTVQDPKKTWEYLLNQAVPSDDDLQQLFLQSLGKASLRSTERRMVAADSSVVIGNVSKPEGVGQLPSIIIFHDLPSSVKATTTISGTLGEDLSNVNQAVVNVVDYRDFQSPSDVLPDAVTAINYHQDFRETVKGPVFLIGIGGGSLPALQAAVNSDVAKNIAGVIVVNGYSSPVKAWEQLQTTNQIEARFYEQYFSCEAGIGSSAAGDVSAEERERITRCLREYDVSGTIKDVPVLSLRTQNHAVVTDAVHDTLKTVMAETNVSDASIETADTSGSIFVNATSPEFLQARSVISEWIKTVSAAAAKATTEPSTTVNTAVEDSSSMTNTTNTTAPIIVQ